MKLDTWWNNSWLQIPQAGYIVNCNWLTFAFVLAILTISLSSFALAFLGIHHLNGNHPCNPADDPHPARGCETGGELDHSEPLGKEAKNLDAWTKMGMKLLHNDGWVVGSWLVNWCKCFFVSICIALLVYLWCWCWCWSCWCWLSVPALSSSSFHCDDIEKVWIDFSGRSLAEGIRGCWWGSSSLINDGNGCKQNNLNLDMDGKTQLLPYLCLRTGTLMTTCTRVYRHHKVRLMVVSSSLKVFMPK